nr:neural cell adhesion molecule 2 [Parasteatoda tepidariorum]
MDTPSSGISLIFLILSVFCTCAFSSQLYLQPTTTDHAYFTGDNFFITCFTIDETIDKLKWTDFDGVPIEKEDGRIHVQPAEGDNQNGRRIVFANVEKDDAGTYTCSDDSDSVSFELVVYRSVSFTDTPREQHAPEGENGLVLCNVRSDPKPVVNWYFKGKKIVSNEKYKVQENHSLKILNLSRSDAGEYKCKAFVITQLGSQVKDFDITLHVQYIPEIIGQHKITTYASKGATKNLICNVTAVPAPMFQWLFDEMIIHNNTDNFVIYDTDNSSVLQLVMDHTDRQGQYICRASNALGEKEVIIDLVEGG